MLVEIIIAHAGRKSGETLELDDSEAVRLISGRWAIPAQPKIERAVVHPKAVETRGKRKK